MKGGAYTLLELLITTLSAKISSGDPTENKTPYLLFLKVLLDTEALKLSRKTIPASPLSWM